MYNDKQDFIISRQFVYKSSTDNMITCVKQKVKVHVRKRKRKRVKRKKERERIYTCDRERATEREREYTCERECV